MSGNADHTASFSAAHAEWHADVEAGRASTYGPLSPTAIHWLTNEPRTLPGLPGVWRADADGLVTVRLPAGSGVRAPGEPAAEPGTSPGDNEASGSRELRIGPLTGTAGETLDWGRIRIEVAARSGVIAVRPRDPDSPTRAAYAGTPVFPPSEAWVTRAEFVARPRADVTVASAAGADRLQHYASPGIARFSIGGRPYELTLFGSVEGGDLRALFADETGSDLTFPAVRFVGVEALPDGSLSIDFNRAVNPPAAYSAAATCPFPPPENRLPVRIEAGEQRPAAILSPLG